MVQEEEMSFKFVPPPQNFKRFFFPITILSHYCKIRRELCHGDDTDFLFPKLSLAFKQGTNKNVLRVVTPHECIPILTYKRKFKSHVDSEELKRVRVSSLDFTSDSLKLGGQLCLVNGIVSPDFSNVPKKPIPVSMEHKPSINVSGKRPLTAVDSVQIPKFGAPISHKVSVIWVTGSPPPLTAAAGGSSQAKAGGCNLQFQMQALWVKKFHR